MSRIEIITIGDELVEGRLVDTNSGEMSDALAGAGLRVARHASVGDEVGEIVAALRDAAGRADAVLVSGGLGPTSDDLTAAAAASAFGLTVERSDEALQHTRRFFAERGREMAPTNLKQADLPGGSTILPNPEGTAVGFRLDAGACRLYFMPGVPRELRRMVVDQVLPDLVARLAPARPLVAELRLFGSGESDVAQRLEGLDAGMPPGLRLVVQYRASFPEIHVRLVVEGEDRTAAAAALATLAGETRRRLGRHVFAVGTEGLTVDFPGAVAANLAGSGVTIAAAEVASAGELALRLAASAEGRRCLLGSLVAADPAVLAGQLGLDGPSAEEAAAEVRRRFGAAVGIATLGTADGSDGGQPGAMVVAVATADRTAVRELSFPIEAGRFRRLAAYAALRLVERTLADGDGAGYQ